MTWKRLRYSALCKVTSLNTYYDVYIYIMRYILGLCDITEPFNHLRTIFHRHLTSTLHHFTWHVRVSHRNMLERFGTAVSKPRPLSPFHTLPPGLVMRPRFSVPVDGGRPSIRNRLLPECVWTWPAYQTNVLGMPLISKEKIGTKR